MQYAEGFVLKDCSLICRECASMFAARVLFDLPPVADSDVVEADLHRVLPHAGLRAALIAVCPFCGYADWSARFERSRINPLLLEPAQEIPHSRKFALAVKHARDKDLDPLDIAYIALNGLYCAREGGELADSWLELCVYEQSRGLDPEEVSFAGGHDHLVMGELWRQTRCFDLAIREYEQASGDESIPPELIRHQMMIARSGDWAPTRLPPWMVRIVFPEAAEVAVSVPVEERSGYNVVVYAPNPLSFMHADPVSGQLYLPPKQMLPSWVRSSDVENLDFEPAFEEQANRRRRASDLVEDARLAEATAETGAPEGEQPQSPSTALEIPVQAILQKEADEDIFTQLANSIDASVSAPAQLEPAPPPETSSVPQPLASAQVPSQPLQSIAVPQAASSVSLVRAGQAGSVSIAISPSVLRQARESSGNAFDWELPPMEAPTNEYFWGASNPDNDKDPVNRALKAGRKGRKGKAREGDDFPEVQICDEDTGHAYTTFIKPVVEEALGAAASGQPQAQPQAGGTYDGGQYNPTAQYASGAQYATNTQYGAAPQYAQQGAQYAQQGAQYDPASAAQYAQPQAQSAGGSAAVDQQESALEERPAVDPVKQVESFLSLTRQPSYQNWVRGYRK